MDLTGVIPKRIDGEGYVLVWPLRWRGTRHLMRPQAERTVCGSRITGTGWEALTATVWDMTDVNCAQCLEELTVLAKHVVSVSRYPTPAPTPWKPAKHVYIPSDVRVTVHGSYVKHVFAW